MLTEARGVGGPLDGIKIAAQSDWNGYVGAVRTGHYVWCHGTSRWVWCSPKSGEWVPPVVRGR